MILEAVQGNFLSADGMQALLSGNLWENVFVFQWKFKKKKKKKKPLCLKTLTIIS